MFSLSFDGIRITLYSFIIILVCNLIHSQSMDFVSLHEVIIIYMYTFICILFFQTDNLNERTIFHFFSFVFTVKQNSLRALMGEKWVQQHDWYWLVL